MKKAKIDSFGDELYTTYETVDKILRGHIADGALRGKRILCPCDPIANCSQQPTLVYKNGVHYAQGNKILREQQFVNWLDKYAEELRIESLTCAGFGDVRFGSRFGAETTEDIFAEKNACDMYLTTARKDYDVIITNPPFSEGAKFVKHLLRHQKDFILILQWNFYCCEAFYDNLDKVKLGAIVHTNENFSGKNIEVNDKKIDLIDKGIERSVGITIFTTFDTAENHLRTIKLTQKYEAGKYPKALNTKEEVIIIDKTANIPYDYKGLMCVPLSFMDNYNSDEFEVIAYSQHCEVDLEKNKMLKNLHDKDVQEIKQSLLLNPKDAKLKRYLARGYSETGFEWRPARLYYKNDKKNLIRNMTGFIVRNKSEKTAYEAGKAIEVTKKIKLLDNKIYIYSSPLVPNCLCIGQTTGDVEKRVKQEFKNTPEAPYKILHSELAQNANGKWFSDKEFHRYLASVGITHEIGNHSIKTEWFKIDLKTAVKLLKKFKKEN